MGWKPRIAAAPTVTQADTRLWVAIAEESAPDAVKLFVAVMNNKKYPIKVRMEAATRLVMIAGATFRGEKLDGQGRPAANLPGRAVTRLETGALREVLRQLPPGSASLSPDAVQEGEKVVILNDGYHSQKPTGHIMQAVVGKLIEKDCPGHITPEQRTEEMEEWLGKRKKVELIPEPVPSGPALDLLSKMLKGPHDK